MQKSYLASYRWPPTFPQDIRTEKKSEKYPQWLQRSLLNGKLRGWKELGEHGVPRSGLLFR